MEESTRSFAPLLLVIFLAFIVPLLLTRIKRLHLPIVVGEIIAGILVGRTGLNWVQGDDPALTLMAEFGFVFLMFLSGMEIDFSSLGGLSGNKSPTSKKSKSWGPIKIGIYSFLLTLILSILISFGLVRLNLAQNPWMLALIMSTTSLGVVVPVLKESGLSNGRYGQVLLVSALIADFVTMLLITVVVAELSHGITLEILLIGLLFVAFFLIYRLGEIFFNRWTAVRAAMKELSHATAQIKVRAAFTIMLSFVVLSEFLGAEIILGAFLAGAIVALLRTPEDAELVQQLETIGFGFFIPIFFIMVGINFNLSSIFASPENLILAPLLLIIALAVKFIPALLLKRNHTWRETLAAGALLSSRLSLIIAASAIGVRLGAISETMNSEIILVAIITVTIGPLLFLRIMPPRKTDIKWLTIVTGADELGLQVAQRLQGHNESILVVDSDEARIKRAQKLGLDTWLGDADCPDPDLSDKFDRAQALVCTHSDIQLSYDICQNARTVFGIVHIVVYISNPGEIARFEKLGVTTVNAAIDRAALLELLTRNPAMYELLTRTTDDKEVAEVIVRNPKCDGKVLGDLNLPGRVRLLALRRDKELIVPSANTRISTGDHLTIVGEIECVENVSNYFSSGPGNLAAVLKDCY